MLKITKWLLFGLFGLLIVVLSMGRIYQVISETRDMTRYPAPGELLVVNHRLMHIHCTGQGSPTVIFELGVGSVAASWADIHQQVAQFTRACAYDRAGLGYSQPTDDSLRASNVAERLQELLLAAGIDDNLVLVGWSAGGIYIREFQRRFPRQVKAMLFAASSHEQQASRTPQTGSGGADPALKIAKLLAPVGIVRLSGIMEQRVDRSSASDDIKARLKAIYQQSHILASVWNESEAFNNDINSPQPPAPIGDLPLIVLTPADEEYSGPDRDAWRELQRELVMLSSNGRQVFASQSGHNIYADQPELLVRSIEELVLLVPGSSVPQGPSPQ